MEVKINLMELSIDEIMRKIKAFKSDTNLTGLTLYVKRNQSAKSVRIIKARSFQPSNVQALIQRRKQAKPTKDADPELKENRAQTTYEQKYMNEKMEDEQSKDKDLLTTPDAQSNATDDLQSLDFVNDDRMAKARKNYAQGNYDMAIAILTQLLDETELGLGKKKNYAQGDKQRKMANITFHLANCYYRKKNYEKAIELYSLQIPEQNYKHKAMRKSNLGAIYLHLKKNQESLRNYTQALKIYGQCGCENMDLSTTYHNVGNIYLRQKMYQIASKYFQKSIQQRKLKSPDAQLPLFYTAFKLGVSQKYEQKYEQSIKSLFYALSFAEREVGDLIEVYKQIALLYQITGKSNDALNYYQKICDSDKATHNDQGYAYERAALIYLNEQQQMEGYRIMKIAEGCYQRAGNERKVSYIKQVCRKKTLEV